ncbi:hypothetical protein CYLTODRAFT_382970 [Cylindrobasidium torrendii FP15055 ss-10]|uniref:Mucoidy inhibitor A n=1 Tax=Cylindrobasidium torrendii FP15055 ss-10 TaxID=1314674 RepID=A0A0D7AXJ3_9AGAR|nr:hypothetical protein CYLTODRAFT_382970 [Cylindrobasidium torrendii FP15055 ss-10]
MSEIPSTVNNVDLIAATDAKIVKVNLYSQRAEVTRLCSFKAVSGVNKVVLKGLSNQLEPASLRVEGRGHATIHDVGLGYTPRPTVPTTSLELELAQRNLSLKKKALERSEQSLSALESYLGTMNVQHVTPSGLSAVVSQYQTVTQGLDEETLALATEVKNLEAEVQREKEKLGTPKDWNSNLTRQVSVSVVTDVEGDIVLSVVYAVSAARWLAKYDIRVDMQQKEKSVKLVYKAVISQNTSEDWTNVPITLETAVPTLGIELPTLSPWNVSVIQPIRAESKKSAFPLRRSRMLASAPLAEAYSAEKEESDDDMGFGLFDDDSPTGMAALAAPVTHIGAYVNSKGNVNASFRIPGLVSVPGTGEEKTFTIAEPELEATISWFSIPKADLHTHMKASIKNSSVFTLLPGEASIYVDGSFISSTHIQDVSPQEKFDCPLGIDPTLRVTYHPQRKNRGQTGLWNASNVYTYAQRITVQNTKADFAVDNLRIVDQIPVSQDNQVTVKLLQPALSLPTKSVIGGTSKSSEAPQTPTLPSVKMEGGVVAQWKGSDEPDVDTASLGKDGMLSFLCGVQPQEKVNITLQWEVSYPAKTSVTGI